jgi:hypothetical protein
VIAAGPANFLILRRLKRRELAWLSLPALVILFSGLAFVAGSRIRGQQAVVNRLAVVRSWPGAGHAQVDGLLGLFSPQRGSYQLVVEAPFLAHAIPADPSTGAGSRMAFIRSDLGDTRLPDLRLDVGEIRTLAVEGQLEAPAIDPDLILLFDERGATLKGSISFQEGEPLQAAVLIAAGKSQKLGDLQPGEQREVAISIDSTSQAVYKSVETDETILWRRGGIQSGWDDLLGTSEYFRDAQINRRYTLLSALFGMDGSQSELANGFVLAGWSEASPLEVSLGEPDFGTSDTTLYLVGLAPELAYARGRLTLPPGLFTWSILDPGAGGEASPYDTYISSGGFGLSFRPSFELPDGEVRRLILHLESYGASGQAGLRAHLWDFNQETWETLPDLEWGETSVESPGDYVGPGGEIRMQLDAGSGLSGQLERADFTLEVEG